MEPKPNKGKFWQGFGEGGLTIFVLINKFLFSRWLAIIFMLSFLAGPMLILGYMYISPEKDTTASTNYAFAFIAGLSSIMFSWSRAVDPKDLKLVANIVHCGEVLLQTALFFLLASGFKYCYIQLFPLIQVIKTEIMYYLYLSLAVILFMVAFINLLQAFTNLWEILAKQMRKGSPPNLD